MFTPPDRPAKPAPLYYHHRVLRTNHWGIVVKSSVPVPGVTRANGAIIREIPFGKSIGGGLTLIGGWTCERGPFNCFGIEDEIWEPDPDCEYSAVVNLRGTVTVVNSVHIKKCALCEPGEYWGHLGEACPGKGDLDRLGDFMAYCLPPRLRSDK